MITGKPETVTTACYPNPSTRPIASALRFALVGLLALAISNLIAPRVTLAQSAAPPAPAPAQPQPPKAQPQPQAHPQPAQKKLPLRIANYSSVAVDCYVDGGLKCQLPAHYKCDLMVPPGHHAVRITRPGGKVYNDSFSLPGTLNGRDYEGGEYLVKEDRVEYALTRPQP
jgi:hypothetical protein